MANTQSLLDFLSSRSPSRPSRPPFAPFGRRKPCCGIWAWSRYRYPTDTRSPSSLFDTKTHGIPSDKTADASKDSCRFAVIIGAVEAPRNVACNTAHVDTFLAQEAAVANLQSDMFLHTFLAVYVQKVFLAWVDAGRIPIPPDDFKGSVHRQRQKCPTSACWVEEYL